MNRSQSTPNLNAMAARRRFGETPDAASSTAGSKVASTREADARQALAIVQSYCDELSSDQHALREALMRAPDGALDLFLCEPQDVLAVPEKVMQAYSDACRAVDRPLSLLRWPDDMREQPAWLGPCPDVTVIDTGFYRGESLDFHVCPNHQRVLGSAGPELRTARVLGMASCDILPYRHNDGFVLIRDKGETVERCRVQHERLASESARMTKNPGVKGFEDLNINCAAVFRGEELGVLRGKPIECRHLAAFWIACRIGHLSRHEGAHRWSGGAPHEPFDYKPFTSVEALESHSEEIADAYYQLLVCGLVAGYGVVRKTAGTLFDKFFQDMDEQCRSFMHAFPFNDKHCMALELRRDVAPDGQVRYCASFYDPNSGAMHLSQWTTNKEEVKTWALQNFFTYSRNEDTQFGMNDNDHELMAVYEVARSFPQGGQSNMNSMRTAPYEHWVPQGEPLHPRSAVQLLRIGRWKEWFNAIQDWRQAHLKAFGVLPMKEEVLAYLSDEYSVQQPWHRDELWQRPEIRHVFMKILLDGGFEATEVNDILCKLMACVPPGADSLNAEQAQRLKGLPEDVRSRVLLEVLDLAMPRPGNGQQASQV
jgi:hypothetical protein